MSKSKNKKTPVALKTSKAPPAPELLDSIEALEGLVENWAGPEGMPPDVRAALSKWGPLAMKTGEGYPAGTAYEAMLLTLRNQANDLVQQLSNPRLGTDELLALRNKAVAALASARAAGTSGKVQPREVLRTLRELGGHFDRGYANMLLSLQPARLSKTLAAVNLDDVLQRAVENPGPESLGEILADQTRDQFPKVNIRLTQREVARSVAEAVDPEARKVAMTEGIKQLEALGATKEQIAAGFAQHAKEYGLAQDAINAARKTEGGSQIIRTLFKSRTGGTSTGKIVGVAALALGALYGITKAFGGKDEKPTVAAPPPRDPMQDVMGALLGSGMYGQMPQSGQNVLELMALEGKRAGEAGEVSGTLEGLQDRQMMEPVRRAQWSRTEVPLAMVLASQAYDAEKARIEGQGPGQVDPRMLEAQAALGAR